MSEPHEPSYYEIALTNRQVTVAFVVLLVCLVGAFFSGVWVGRSGAESVAPKPAPAQQAANGAAPLEEFHFFSDAAKPEKTPAAAPEPSAAAVAASPAASSPAPEPPPPSPSPTPSATSVASPVATPSPGPRKPEPATKPTPVPTLAAEPASELAPGEMVVQVFSSPDGEQAKKIVARLKSGGFKAFLSPIEKSGKTVYRVRIGPFTDHGAAQKVADQVRKKYRYDTWITR